MKLTPLFVHDFRCKSEMVSTIDQNRPSLVNAWDIMKVSKRLSDIDVIGRIILLRFITQGVGVVCRLTSLRKYFFSSFSVDLSLFPSVSSFLQFGKNFDLRQSFSGT